LDIRRPPTAQIGAAPILTRADDRSMKRNLTRTVLLATLSLLFAASALAAPEIVRSGNLVLTDDGGLMPQKLPRDAALPPPPGSKPRSGPSTGATPRRCGRSTSRSRRRSRSTRSGLPICREGQIIATSTATAKKACGDALLGSGSAQVEVAFEEQAPFSATGPLLLFNAGVQGATTKVLLHAYVDIPAPTAIVVPADIVRIHDGPYGLEIRAQIPRIAGGAGSVTKFALKVGRKFSYKGRPRSFITAGCPTGHWWAKGEAGFSDGTKLQVLHVFPCTPGLNHLEGREVKMKRPAHRVPVLTRGFLLPKLRDRPWQKTTSKQGIREIPTRPIVSGSY
jgi:hypothetical protein